MLEVETPDSAAMNVAIDEAILVEGIGKTFPPTVRFWRNKRAVIIGNFQSAQTEANLDLCKENAIQIVRRFTGGGAVYHDLGNLNYSIAISANHSLISGLGLIDSFRVLTSGIIAGLREIGIETVFSRPSDLLIKNRKISGSAQSRRKGVVFHHGTLLVRTDLDMLARVLDSPRTDLDNRKVPSRKMPVINLEDEVKTGIDMHDLKKFILQGFEKAFSAIFTLGVPTQTEKTTAQKLYAEKYSKDEWNLRL